MNGKNLPLLPEFIKLESICQEELLIQPEE